jgi:type I restriction enzyme S subunit
LNSIRPLPADTLLVTCIASIGKNAIMRAVGSCNQQINALIPARGFSADFLYYLFEANKQYLLENAGTTATSIISKAVFMNLTFIVLILSEQSAIATTLSDMDAEIAALEAKLTKARQLKKAMMQELLTGRIRLQ